MSFGECAKCSNSPCICVFIISISDIQAENQKLKAQLEVAMEAIKIITSDHRRNDAAKMVCREARKNIEEIGNG